MKRDEESSEGRAAAQSRARALVFLIIAVGAGFAAVMLVKRYTDQITASASNVTPKTTQVVVAATNLPIATHLEEKHLALVNWPVDAVPEGTFEKLEDVVDRTLRQDLVKGEPILKERLADEDKGQGLAALLADGMRAMAVKVDAFVGVAGFVQPGDAVDVITTISPDEETRKLRSDEASQIAKIVLQNVRVLAVGEHLTSSSGGRPINVQVVTLGVTVEESEKLALASQVGRLQLSLRSRIDQQVEATPGITPANLLVPDAETQAKQVAEAPKQVFRYQHHRKAPKAQPEPAAPPPPPKPEAPVVEILRGSKIENRTLRTQGVSP